MVTEEQEKEPNIITSTQIKQLFRNKYAHACAAPFNDYYRHMYDICTALLANPTVRKRLLKEIGEAEFKEREAQILALSEHWIIIGELQQRMEDIHKRFRRMGDSESRESSKSGIEDKLIKEVIKRSKELPPLVHTLMDMTFKLIDWCDLKNLSISIQHINMARGDKLPYRMDDYLSGGQ